MVFQEGQQPVILQSKNMAYLAVPTCRSCFKSLFIQPLNFCPHLLIKGWGERERETKGFSAFAPKLRGVATGLFTVSHKQSRICIF